MNKEDNKSYNRLIEAITKESDLVKENLRMVDVDLRLLKLVTKYTPEKIAEEMVGVQPMNEEVGKAVKILSENDWILIVRKKEDDK